MSMSEVEKTCENCEYEHEDLEGTHCRHCIHIAEEHFKLKEIRATEQEIRNKAIDEFTEKLSQEFIRTDEDGNLYIFAWITDFREIAEQMKGV